ncbi:MAG TPA: tryptophan synthase subunit alpha [Tepidisphaeraceae bacterium]|jgi:tryptophan synthase alpha chain|nr:tryptophan synthase subunit alpha [Tepidisphaeraceae bacterium]
MDPTRAQRRSISAKFAQAKAAGRIGLISFIPAGFPDLPATAALIKALDRAGSTVIEVGFPFSDPIADGPVIQEAFVDALARKVKIADVFATVAGVRGDVSAPIVGMLSYSIVFRYGIERFLKQAKESGFDGLILPDLPPPEIQNVCGMIRSAGLDTILLVAPTTTAERRREIVRLSSGFVYYLSVSGITGERDSLPSDLSENVRQIKSMTQLPVCVGFGISQPRHVAQLKNVADGAIVGTAIVRRIKSNIAGGTDAIANAVESYAREMIAHS